MKTRILSRRFLPVCSLAALVALSGCVRQEDVDALNSRVMRQDQQIQMLNSQLSGVQPAQADTWSQVQSTRQEIATLRGQIDDMQMRLNATGWPRNWPSTSTACSPRPPPRGPQAEYRPPARPTRATPTPRSCS